MSALDERYDIESELGRGPSACVFSATEKSSSRMVALKRLEPGDERAGHFPYAAEWEKISSLNHPAIVKAIEHLEEEGEKYIISEYCRGETLEQRVMRTGPIPEEECIPLFRSIAMGLNHCHEKGLLHLNIKPSNVFLSQDGDGNLIGHIADFGQWTMGIDGGNTGPAMAFYKSPEQRRGTGIMVSSDIYALGKLLYVAISGEMNGRITPTALPEYCYLQEIIYCCIRTRMEDRYQSMREVIQCIDRIEAEYFSGYESEEPAQPSTDYVDMHSMGRESRPGGDVSLSGQSRADAEIQSITTACRSHFSNRKLRTCRKLMAEVRGLVEKYSEFQSAEWVQNSQAELDIIESELAKKERELNQMVVSAEEAFNDARYEDVQMLATAAAEVCCENTGCELLVEEANKAMGNIRTFLEDAFQSMKLKEYRRAELDLIKVLEINPKHISAIQMREKIKGIMRRKKMVRFCLKLLPILLITVGAAGGYFFFQRDYNNTVKKFQENLEAGRATDAESAANKLVPKEKNFLNDLYKQVFDIHEPAKAFLADHEEAKGVYSEALEAQNRFSQEEIKDERIKTKIEHATQILSDAEKHLSSCKSKESCELSEQSRDLFITAYLDLISQEVEFLFREEKWQEAHNRLKRGLAIREDETLNQQLMKARGKLVPELSIDALVGGKRATGAMIIKDGVIMKKTTPATFLMDIGIKHSITVILRPRGNKYYKPVTQTIEFTSKEAKKMTFNLEVLPGPEVDKEWTVKAIKLNLVPVKSGTFQMGSESGQLWERPVNKVKISKPFWIGKYEITREQYMRVMTDTTPAETDSRFPAANILWSRAADFCNKVNRQERRNNRIPVGYEYRLPTEAEWEYCAKTGAVEGGDINEVAWHAGNSSGKYKEIGTKKANSWGIYDLQGNVAEWCADFNLIHWSFP